MFPEHAEAASSASNQWALPGYVRVVLTDALASVRSPSGNGCPHKMGLLSVNTHSWFQLNTGFDLLAGAGFEGAYGGLACVVWVWRLTWNL